MSLPSLPSLPVELIDHVASYLDLPTFNSLRLTASRYQRQTAHRFMQRFFTTQHLQWRKSSLERLVDVSTDPNLCGACHHLIIDATPHHALLLWKMQRHIADAGHLTPMTDAEGGSELVKRLSDDCISMQQEAQNVSRWLTETRFDVKCLTAVFAQLNSLESITFAYDSMDTQYSKFAYRYCHRSQHEMSRPFKSTLSALAASKLAVKHIRMHAEKKHGVISVGRLESLAPLLGHLDAAFENLQTLQLNLRDWRSPDSGFEIQTTRAPFVVRFLAKCSNVRKLELSCYSELEYDLLGSLSRICRLTRLERCKLDFMRISHAEDLIDFLALSSSSLEELHLQHMLLADLQTSWIEIFNSLTDAPLPLTSLRLLKISRLCSQGILDTVRNVLFHDQDYQSYSLQIEGDDWRAQLKARGYKYTMLSAARSWEAGSTCYPFVGLKEHP